MTGRLLTARIVAGQLGLSTETVLSWQRRGLLPAIRLPGGAIRFREDELDAWLEERRTKRTTPGRGVPTPNPDAVRTHTLTPTEQENP